jgi:uncharacterized protein involved in tellurium resistance
MNISFTKDQMIQALERIGYEIKEESYELENVDWREVNRYRVYSVFYNGVNVFGDQGGLLSPRSGLRPVEEVFSNELHKRLLILF